MKSNTVKNLLVLSLVFTVGCVSASKYNDLEEEHGRIQEQLAVCDAKRAELEKKLGISSTERSRLEGSVADMRKALAEAEARKTETEKRLLEFRELTAKFKSLVDAGKLTIKVQNGRMMIALSSDILFPSGSEQLSGEGKHAIREVTGLLKDLKNRNYQIEGHTDNVPIHTKQFPSNWELASARAMSVLNTMLAAGFPAERVSAASYGSSEPVGDNKTESGRAENRRIAIVIVPDLSSLPGFDELNRLSATPPAPKATSKASPAASPVSNQTKPSDKPYEEEEVH